jgi:hypothetical protein
MLQPARKLSPKRSGNSTRNNDRTVNPGHGSELEPI